MNRAADLEAEDAAGFVLAGGRSSRMGIDKALLQFQGVPLLLRSLAALRAAGLSPAVIAGERSDLANFAPVIEDAGSGPLGGICAGLETTSTGYAVFLPVDMPLLPPQLLSFLLDRSKRIGAGVSVFSVSGFAQTFPVVVHRDMTRALRAEFQAGNDGCFSAFRAAAAQTGRSFEILPIENLVQAGQIEDPGGVPQVWWFTNVNTPDDLDRAEALVARHRVS